MNIQYFSWRKTDIIIRCRVPAFYRNYHSITFCSQAAEASIWLWPHWIIDVVGIHGICRAKQQVYVRCAWSCGGVVYYWWYLLVIQSYRTVWLYIHSHTHTNTTSLSRTRQNTYFVHYMGTVVWLFNECPQQRRHFLFPRFNPFVHFYSAVGPSVTVIGIWPNKHFCLHTLPSFSCFHPSTCWLSWFCGERLRNNFMLNHRSDALVRWPDLSVDEHLLTVSVTEMKVSLKPELCFFLHCSCSTATFPLPNISVPSMSVRSVR